METPINYLWRELDALLSDATLDDLRKRYDAHKHRYELTGKIRRAQRDLAMLEQRIVTKGPGTPRYKAIAAQIDRRRARIKALEDEQNVIEHMPEV